MLELETGPSCIHFDHPPDQLQNRKGEKFDFGDSYAYVVEPLIRKYGYEKLCCHINTLRGSTEQQMKPVVTGLAELTYLQPRASTNWLKTILPIMEENGLAFEIAVHVNSELDLARRILLEPGLIKKPAMWCVLYGLPMKGPRWHFEFIPNEMAMAQHLVLTVERIREMDPEARIQVMQGARPSRYMVVLAMLLGLNIRVGHEDSVFKYPHKDEPLVSNAEEVKWAIETARLLGRRSHDAGRVSRIHRSGAEDRQRPIRLHGGSRLGCCDSSTGPGRERLEEVYAAGKPRCQGGSRRSAHGTSSLWLR